MPRTFPPRAARQGSPPIGLIREQMKGHLNAHGYPGLYVIDRDERILASSYDELIGTEIDAYLPFFEAALGGNAGISKPVSQHDPAAPTAAAASAPACRR